MEKKQQILEILAEAKAHGLQWEVEQWANKYIQEGEEPVQAYLHAFESWIK